MSFFAFTFRFLGNLVTANNEHCEKVNINKKCPKLYIVEKF